MKLLQWFIGLAMSGVAMIVAGVIGVPPGDGLVIGGSIIVGAGAISLAMLATAKK
jgi:hypothetical protein